MNRTKFLSKISYVLVTLVLFAILSCTNKQKKIVEETTPVSKEEKTPFFKLSLAQWSFHKAIRSGEMSPIDFAQKASELGFEGIEYVSQLYREELKKDPDPKVAMQNLLDTLKMKSEKHGVKNVLIMVDGEGNLGAIDSKKRAQVVENHKKWVDAAAFLGCHSIRVNAKGKGTADEVATAVVDGLTKLSEYAQKKGINILVENHGGYSSNAEWLVNVMKAVGKSNVGTLPDFGNFCQTIGYGSINDKNCKDAYDIYKGVGEMMPFAKAVSAKSYDFDENGNQTKIDYVKMLQIVKDAGYTNYIGVEYEGNNLSEKDGIIATKELLLRSALELK